MLCAETAAASSTRNQCTAREGTSHVPVGTVLGRAALAGKSLPACSSLLESQTENDG